MYSAFMSAGLKGLTETLNVRGKGSLIRHHFTSNCKIQSLYLSKKLFSLLFIINSNNILVQFGI